MATDMENGRATELNVRMGCDGCARRVMKALRSVEGVYNVYVDLPRQKLTVIGRAEADVLIKAIKKTGKVATMCFRTNPVVPEPPTEAAASSRPPAPDTANQTPTETSSAEDTPSTEPPKDNQPQESQATDSSTPKPQAPIQDVEQVYVVQDYPQSNAYRENWKNSHPMGHEISHEAPYYVTHHMPSPQTEYASPSSDDVQYYVTEAYNDGNYQNKGGEGNQITSMFSDENPNACGIV